MRETHNFHQMKQKTLLHSQERELKRVDNYFVAGYYFGYW